MTRPRIAPGGTGRPRSKTSTTITVTHEHVPRWVEAAKRAGMSPPQYVASVMDGQASAWGDAWRAGYKSAMAHASEALERLPEPESVVRVPRVGDLVRTKDDPTPRRVRWVGPSDHGPVVDLEAAGSHALNLIADLLSDQPKRSDE